MEPSGAEWRFLARLLVTAPPPRPKGEFGGPVERKRPLSRSATRTPPDFEPLSYLGHSGLSATQLPGPLRTLSHSATWTRQAFEPLSYLDHSAL
eukprot:gene4170-14270_t